eukprot:gnl/TRDRNA2_/TRDRNA2_186498_c0_seq1.p1 gnl/TRDRNA2_/TRDRNA2_186498_c0~~gnl/TRDRNA2_/TRDRNA2_186498_c0_seq1.p1  ORF type:complete len:163 (-),score=17.23 gnl/TRDRNA2_/TRDRNA2_186498_c0_seq1:54-542(-)
MQMSASGFWAVLALFVLLSCGPACTLAGRTSWRKTLTARHLANSGRPDPYCKTGVLSLTNRTDNPQVCCAGYCGECSDYPTCRNVRGQDSANACCKSKVLEMACGSGAAANVCIKPCSQSVPPCIMDGNNFTAPDPNQRNAGDDCGEAKKEWRAKADSAMNR